MQLLLRDCLPGCGKNNILGFEIKFSAFSWTKTCLEVLEI